MTMNFNELPEFKRELKQLHKKYTSLTEDLSTFRDVLFVTPLGNSRHFAVVTRTETIRIVRARLFCRYLKGSSLRIIYSWNEQEQRIEFIQLYFKGDKDQRRPRANQELPKEQPGLGHSRGGFGAPFSRSSNTPTPSAVVKSVLPRFMLPQAPPLAPSTQHPAVQR